MVQHIYRNRLLARILAGLVILAGTACTSTTRHVGTDIKPTEIAKHVHPGDRVQVTTQEVVVTMQVTGYESGNTMLGRDLTTGKGVSIPLEAIREIRTVSTSANRESVEEAGEYATYTIAAVPLLPLGIITSPFWGPAAAELEEQREQHKELNRLLKADGDIYDKMTPAQILAKLGKPTAQYRYASSGLPGYRLIWEYADDRMPEGKKHLHFSQLHQELYMISAGLPIGSEVYLGKPQDLLPTAEDLKRIEADARPRQIARQLGTIRYAQAAVSRGDFEAAYRLLEDLLVSEFAEVQLQAREFLSAHPQILKGARESFSPESLNESLNIYGEESGRIESKRLEIYKTIVSEEDYRRAERNFWSVFGMVQ